MRLAAEQFLEEKQTYQFKNTILALATEAAILIPEEPEQAVLIFGELLQEIARVKYYPPKKPRPCGNINAELTLTDRTYLCKRCGMVKDRDLNAAENLNRAGLARIHACGHDGSVSVT